MRAFDDYDIVLCRAEEAGNVGSACRALKTMGFSRLVLADCPEYAASMVKTFSVHAFDVYESAARFSTLGSALAPCALAAGFTRRTGKTRTPRILDVRQFSRMAAERGGRIALVFGNERDGLSDEELTLCDIAVRIPTSEAFPSLNLAQAVQIACWELSRNLLAPEGETGKPSPLLPEPQSHDRIAQVSASVAEELSSIGFFRIAGRKDLERFIRSLLARAGTSAKELEYFEYIVRKTLALSARGAKDGLTPDPDGARVFPERLSGCVLEGDEDAKT